MNEIELFCNALNAENPAGADLEYDPAFLALESAQKIRPERQFGDTVIAAEQPDWKQVLEQATALGRRTRDLRIACALTRALTHLQGLEGLVHGLQIIDRLCREMWQHVFPALDDSEDNDPTIRINALAPLADREQLLADIRGCQFVAARGMGGCTVRQLEIALGILTPAANDTGRLLSLADIDALVAAAQAEGGFTDNFARQASGLAHGLQAYLSELVGPERAPDLQPLIGRLRPLADYANKFVPAKQSDVAQARQQEGVASAPASGAVPGNGEPRSGEIRSSQDAARLLELVCAYFEQHEPTNPAPLLLRRAQRLATMNFLEIVRDIAPDAMSSVALIAGTNAES